MVIRYRKIDIDIDRAIDIDTNTETVDVDVIERQQKLPIRVIMLLILTYREVSRQVPRSSITIPVRFNILTNSLDDNSRERRTLEDSDSHSHVRDLTLTISVTSFEPANV